MDDANQEYIRDYWNDELTGTERAMFEEKCIEDEGFANSVAQFMRLKKIAKETEKDRLKTLYKNNQKSNQNRMLIFITGLFLIAAIVFRMFFASSDTIEKVKPIDEDRIFAMLVEENKEASRGDGEVKKPKETTSLDLTKVENVNELIEVGQSLYQKNESIKMIDLIDDYMNNNIDDISRKDELLWLQTLAYLKTNDKEKAKRNLEEILKKYRLFQKEAKEMLDFLK
jgi:hypothetical protein